MLRQPIVTVVGHIDHGKTSLLDSIRRSALTRSEAGGITQCISSSTVSMETIKKICGDSLKALNLNLSVPGLLFIDTPGHAAFNNLRKRGGNLADIAILIVDLNEGLMPQTIESIEVLKSYKTPFILAANKIDLVPGFQKKSGPVLKQINEQQNNVREEIDKRIYELVGSLYKHGFQSERFDRVSDYTKQIAIIPISAKEMIGTESLLMVLVGMAQRFLEKNLNWHSEGPAKGTVLEVKEKQGMGTVIDAIIYDGSLNVSDTIVIGGLKKPIVTKVRALFEPGSEKDITDKKATFKSVKRVVASTGVRISAPELDDVIAGVPFITSEPEGIEDAKLSVQSEIKEVIMETENEGIIVKADSLGSLEALVNLLKEKGISIMRASVGKISKKDVMDASSLMDSSPEKSVILGFNTSLLSDIDPGNVKIITNAVIYKLIEDLENFNKEIEEKQMEKGLDLLVKPCKIELLRGYVFRQNNPAVCGIEVISGTLKAGTPLMKTGKRITIAKSLQMDKESVKSAEKGKKLAVSMPDVTVGRQINEGDVLISAIPEEDFKKLKKLKKFLSADEIEIMRDVAQIMRKENPVWGI